MSSRMPSFLGNSKCASKERLAKGKSPSNHSISPTSNIKSVINVGPTQNLSNTRICKKASGGLLAGAKNPLRSPGSVTFPKRSTGNIPSIKRSMPLAPDDAPPPKSILKKKSMLNSGERKNSKISSKSPNPRSSTDRVTGKNAEKDSNSKSLKSTKCITMHGEGPKEIPAEKFHVHNILSKPKVWEIEDGVDEDEDDSTVSSPCPWSPGPTALEETESEVWGSMRTSTPETARTSTPPSLTSFVETDDEKKWQTMHKEREPGTEPERDENNNVIDAITVIRTFPELEGGHSESHKEASEMASAHRGENNDRINILENQRLETAEATVKGGGTAAPVGVIISLEDPMHQEINGVNDGRILDASVLSCEKGLTKSAGNTEKAEDEPVSLAKPETSMMGASQPGTKQVSQSETGSSPTLLSATQLIPNQGKCETEIMVERKQFSGGERRSDDTNTVHLSRKSNNTLAAGRGEFFNADAIQMEPPPQHKSPKLDNQQTQTQRPACVDAEVETETGSEIEDRKREKMMRLVMTVNTGVDISPELDNKTRPRGILKGLRAKSGNIEELRNEDCQLAVPNDVLRKRSILQRVKYPQTFSQVGADYGFPSEISMDDLVKTISQPWEAISKTTQFGAGEDMREKDGTCCFITKKEQGERDFIGAAYAILNSSFKYASELIGVERDLEPREDRIRYNGYNISICGKGLLLESLHVNCDFGASSQFSGSQSNTSVTSLESQLPTSKESVEKCRDAGRRRIRIVIRVNENIEQEDKDTQLTHRIGLTDGKWTFMCGNGEHSDNFVEICCPTGVHPENLAYGLLNGLLLVDAP